MNFRKNIITKKAWRYGASIPRFCSRLSSDGTDWKRNPAVLVNSFPKSGTHLLSQILGVLPGLRDWGNFWASNPSLTLKERAPVKMAKSIRGVASGELVCAHLNYSEPVAEALRDKNIVHYFIYRDPRDVVVSEAYYLAHMNRWHRMHNRFKRLGSQTERVLLSIRGLPEGGVRYPNIGERFKMFEGWINNPSVCSITYEDLVSERQEEVLRKIFCHYEDQVGAGIDVEEMVAASQEAIDPHRSHTFRRGGSGGWKADFNEDLTSAFKAATGDLLVKLGYEESGNW
ncbi:Sulfotransferase domain superfamily [Verrucomicrobiia bacterium DG1235]|nr:Sulfotransferase domain superfamily [Verrucomicrobiae bacterium DG1235]